MKYFFILFIFLFPLSIYSEVQFEFDFSMIKINSNDEFVGFQLFDYDDDGTDEILTSFRRSNRYRIVCYNSLGDTVFTYFHEFENNEERFGQCHVFSSSGFKILITSFIPLDMEPGNYSGIIKISLCDLNSLTIVDTFSTSLESYQIGAITDLLVKEYADSSFIIYCGIDRNDLRRDCAVISCTYKYLIDNNQIEPLDNISNFGEKFLSFPEYDYVLTMGTYSYTMYGAWPHQYLYRYLGVLSHDLESDLTQLLSVNGSAYYGETSSYSDFPDIAKFVSYNDHDINQYGFAHYYRTKDTSDGNIPHFNCYDPETFEIIWSTNESDTGSIIRSSTCVDVEIRENCFLYFGNNHLEIRNRLNGEIIYSQETDINPFVILENSNNELLFVTERESDDGFDVYRLTEDIQVDAIDNTVSSVDLSIIKISPNPFNPNTTIEFSLNEPGLIDVSIVNVKGQKIKTIKKSYCDTGVYSISWDGSDDSSKILTSGIYFILIKKDNIVKAVDKCLLLK